MCILWDCMAVLLHGRLVFARRSHFQMFRGTSAQMAGGVQRRNRFILGTLREYREFSLLSEEMAGGFDFRLWVTNKHSSHSHLNMKNLIYHLKLHMSHSLPSICTPAMAPKH